MSYLDKKIVGKSYSPLKGIVFFFPGNSLGVTHSLVFEKLFFFSKKPEKKTSVFFFPRKSLQATHSTLTTDTNSDSSLFWRILNLIGKFKICRLLKKVYISLCPNFALNSFYKVRIQVESNQATWNLYTANLFTLPMGTTCRSPQNAPEGIITSWNFNLGEVREHVICNEKSA